MMNERKYRNKRTTEINELMTSHQLKTKSTKSKSTSVNSNNSFPKNLLFVSDQKGQHFGPDVRPNIKEQAILSTDIQEVFLTSKRQNIPNSLNVKYYQRFAVRKQQIPIYRGRGGYIELMTSSGKPKIHSKRGIFAPNVNQNQPEQKTNEISKPKTKEILKKFEVSKSKKRRLRRKKLKSALQDTANGQIVAKQVINSVLPGLTEEKIQNISTRRTDVREFYYLEKMIADAFPRSFLWYEHPNILLEERENCIRENDSHETLREIERNMIRKLGYDEWRSFDLNIEKENNYM